MSKKNLDVNGGLTRRTFVKGAGATAGAAAVGMGANRLEAGPVQEAEAVPPLIIAGAAIGASVAVGWALREFEVVGADDPPEGLTPGALHEQTYSTTRTRQSTNASTFIDNQNILEGVKHSAYADGKIAAIEALNEEAAKSEVQSRGVDAVESYETTIKQNFLRSWNESGREIKTLYDTIQAHADLTRSTVFPKAFHHGNAGWEWMASFETTERNITMPNGETFTLVQLDVAGSTAGSGTDLRSVNSWDPIQKYDPADGSNNTYYWRIHVAGAGGGTVEYLKFDEWNGMWSAIDTTFSDVKDGLALWVDSVYSSVQAGELDTSELLTPRELAEMTADQEDYNQAIADLMALNISVNLEREAEIRLPDIGATLYGSIGVSGDTTLSVGTIDPAADEYSYYFTYNVAEGEGTWDAFTAGVDGGVVTFTSEPFASTSYFITTNAGETAEVTAADFTDQGDGTWTVDVSGQLETAITEVTSVEYFSESTATDYQTVQLTSPFEIVTFRDSEGNEVDSADYTSTAPQDDTNYITKEEWQAQEDRYLELIEKYEESQGGAGFAGLLEGEGGIVVLALAAAAAFGLIKR